LVGVDVLDGENDRSRGDGGDLFDYVSYRASVILLVTAAGAAVSGLARNVRPPAPCRPSKLRLLVLTAYCPGDSWSPFIAMHIEQPASRHSAPASRNTWSRPSASAAALICCDPGTTSTRTPAATLRPFITPAAARRSDSRELVQLPMNTTSSLWPSSGCCACRPMYASAFAAVAFSGSGTALLIGMPMPGLVP